VQDEGGLDPATPEADTPLTLNVFLSYRRDDAAAYALLLFQSLSDRYGHNVFMDIETLAPGMDFVDAINDTLGRCDILLALVGRGWLTASDAEGNPRLENPEDFVRLEIEAALARNIRVVPVLVGGALMPRRNQLPGDLAKLARRHAFELSDTRWRTDVAALIKAIEHVPESAPAKPLEPESPVSTSASESAGGVEVEAASLTEEPVADAPAVTKLMEQPEPALVEEPAVPPAATTLVEEGSQSPQETVDESTVASESDARVDLLGVSAEERSPEELERTEQPPLEEKDGTKEQRVEFDTASPKRLEPSQFEPKIKDLPLRNAILPISTVDVPSAISEPIDHERMEPSVEQGTAETETAESETREDAIDAEVPTSMGSTVGPPSGSRLPEAPVEPKAEAVVETIQEEAVSSDMQSRDGNARKRRRQVFFAAGAAVLIILLVIAGLNWGSSKSNQTSPASTNSSQTGPLAWSQPSSIDASGGGLNAVSCPSSSFCVAVDSNANALTFNGCKWSQSSSIDAKGGGLNAVSCPSSSFCVAVDGNGNAVVGHATT
jgi:hypothetical protein